MTTHDMYGNSNRRAYASTFSDLGDTGTTVRAALLDDSYVPDLSAHEVFSDVNESEVTGDGYTSGGQEIGTKSLTEDNLVTTFDGDNVTWDNSTITAHYAVVYEDTGDSTTSSLISLVDFEGEESSEDGDFSIEWAADGIFEVEANPA